MKIFIKCLGSSAEGSHIGLPDTFEVCPNDTVSRLKGMISDALDMPVNNLKLLSSGKTLSDTCTLSSCNLSEGSKVHLLIKPWATPPHPAILPKLSTELTNFLRQYYTEIQCQTIIKNVFLDLQKSVDSLSLDDIEALATEKIRQNC